jgi:hypothetical protein
MMAALSSGESFSPCREKGAESKAFDRLLRENNTCIEQPAILSRYYRFFDLTSRRPGEQGRKEAAAHCRRNGKKTMETRERQKRKFTLLDVMILVAASAIALGIIRALEPDRGVGLRWLAGAWACLATLSWAILFLRLKQPRPTLRRMISRPGDAACIASVLATVLTGLVSFVALINKMFSSSPMDFSEAPVIGVVATGPAVLACWLIMVLGRRWRPENDWIGVLGRALAVGWVLTFFATGMLM